MLVDLLKTAEEQYGPEVAEVLQQMHVRALHLQVPPRPGHEGMSGCWFGGRPTLPPEIDWPVYVHNGHAIPMHFLAQFDCASLPKLEEYLMPESGTVMFFYEPHLNMERFDMTYKRVAPDTLPLRTQRNLDRYGQRYSVEREEGGRVIYIPDADGVPLRDPPPRPDIDPEALDRTGPDGDFLDCRFDVEDWNTRYRGTPPMFEGPIPVEAVEMCVFDQRTMTKAKYKITNELQGTKLWKDILFFNERFARQFSGDASLSKHFMFGPPQASSYSDNPNLRQIFFYNSSEYYSGADGIAGFIAHFMINFNDLLSGNLEACICGEDSW